MFLSNKKKIIAITGASGWLGKNLVFRLLKILGNDNFDLLVDVYSSKNQSLIINNHIINFKCLTSIKEESLKKQYQYIISCAFIVRDHINKSGINKYIKMNREIIDISKNCIKNSPNCKVLLFSSGAASKYATYSGENQLNKDPYGVLKREEELIYQEFSDCCIMRIYALSGKYMRNLKHFALGNFILQAIKKSSITIDSKRTIIRGYANSSDIAEISLTLLLTNKFPKFQNQIINAVSSEISLLELARTISKRFGGLSIFHNINYDLEAEIYSASPKQFLSLANLFKKNLMTIEQQIDETINDINKEL